MKGKTKSPAADHSKAWLLDQLTKSEFFHQKLHEWGLLAVASAIEKAKGEQFKWDISALDISKRAWEKVIHRGIKPVAVFAHPVILEQTVGAVGYYRMLSMVSQKSMNRVGIPVVRYEEGRNAPAPALALAIAKHLNHIISRLINWMNTLTPVSLSYGEAWRRALRRKARGRTPREVSRTSSSKA